MLIYLILILIMLLISSYMFYNCHILKNINLSSFNTQKVTYMQHMFEHCPYLEKVDISNFNTQNVTNMESFFDRYGTLKIKNVITNDENILKLLKK